MTGPNVPVSGPEDRARERLREAAMRYLYRHTGHNEDALPALADEMTDELLADLSVVADTTAGEAEIPYMLDNTPAEFERVRAVAARRHDDEASHLAARSGGAQDDGLRGRVEKLAEEWERNSLPVPEMTGRNAADRLRRALAGPDDARQDGVCEAVNPETGRRCVRPWPHDGMHQVADGRWFGDDPRRGLPTTSRPWT